MTEFLGRINDGAQVWADAMTRACLIGGAAILLAWCVTRMFPRLPAKARDWIWRIAYLKLLVALIWVAPIELPLLPASTTMSEPQSKIVSDMANSVLSGLAIPGSSFGQASPGVELRDDSLPMVAFSFSTIILAVWCAGVGVCSLAIGRNWFATCAVCQRAQPVTDPQITDIVTELWRRIGVVRGPSMRRCDVAVSPQLVGVFRPAIILPATLPTDVLSYADVRMIIAHELAHWRRRDLWWNWLPALAHVLFFFHPAVWLAHREWRLAREIACDEAAIGLGGVKTANYGQMLLNVVQHCRITATPSFFSVGVSHSFQTLSRRIIAMQSTVPLSQSAHRTITTLLFVGAVVVLIPWRLVAQETDFRVPEKVDGTLVTEKVVFQANDAVDVAELPPATQLPGRLYVQCSLQQKNVEAGPKVKQNLVIEINPNTGEWKTITQSGHSVRVSPDGSSLVFERPSLNFEVGADRNAEIWMCDVRTGVNARRVVAGVGGRPIWSPDGLELVCSDGQTNEEDKKETPEKPVWNVVTWKFSHDGGEKTKLPIPSEDFVEDWSPDGQWFVTSSDRHAPYGRGYQIYLMRTDGTEQRRLTEGQGLNVYVRFSPDGARVLFLHQEKGKNSVRTIELVTGKETVLIEDDGLRRVNFACWSPGGEHLVILREDWERNEKGKRHRGSNAKPRLAILDLETKDLREIALPGAEVQWLGHVDWK